MARMIDSAINLGGITGLFDEYGRKLLDLLAVIAVAWTAIKAVMEEKGIRNIFLELLTIVLIWGIAAWFISKDERDLVSQKDDRGRVTYVTPLNSILGGFEFLSNKIMDTIGGPNMAAAKTPAQKVENVMMMSMMAAGNLFSSNPKKVSDPDYDDPAPDDYNR